MIPDNKSDPELLKALLKVAGHAAPPTTPVETDPNGLDQHAPGAKLDAGKTRVFIVEKGFARALDAVYKVGSDGATTYTPFGWEKVPDGEARYDDAAGRHRMARLKGQTHDTKTGSRHRAHEIWNLLAVLELELRAEEAK